MTPSVHSVGTRTTTSPTDYGDALLSLLAIATMWVGRRTVVFLLGAPLLVLLMTVSPSVSNMDYPLL